MSNLDDEILNRKQELKAVEELAKQRRGAEYRDDGNEEEAEANNENWASKLREARGAQKKIENAKKAKDLIGTGKKAMKAFKKFRMLWIVLGSSGVLTGLLIGFAALALIVMMVMWMDASWWDIFKAVWGNIGPIFRALFT